MVSEKRNKVRFILTTAIGGVVFLVPLVVMGLVLLVYLDVPANRVIEATENFGHGYEMLVNSAEIDTVRG